MSELLTCPFCGGEARILEKTMFDAVFFGAKCVICGAEAAAKQNEAEAIAAWNTRAERTCHDVSADSSTQFYCSKCECTVDVPLLWGVVNYCPNCGAKVVSE